MQASDWKQIGKIGAAPDPDMLEAVIAAPNESEAYTLTRGRLSRDVCRALRRFAEELKGVQRHVLMEAIEKQHLAEKREREITEAMQRAQLLANVPLSRLRRPKKQSAKKHIATAHATLTDVHCGLAIRLELAYGHNEYNLQIMRERMGLWVHRVTRLFQLRASHRHIDTLVIWGLSDFINGELHEGDGAQSCVLGAPEAAAKFTGAFAAAIEQLAENLPDVSIVVVIVPGNHDRTTRKPDDARGALTSWSWMIGYALESRYWGTPLAEKVRFIRPVTPMHTLECADGLRVRGMHGNQFIWNKGIGGPEVSIRRTLREYDKITPADTTVMGHFHCFRTPGDFLISPAFVGATPWSLNKGFPLEKPGQLFFLSDSHYNLSGLERVLLV